jgi:hypothetical protein
VWAPSEKPHGEPTKAGAGACGFLVTVVHGDLGFARFPIVVGHYESDTIIGAEAVIDRLFDGALTTRYNLGLYPGPLGTHTVVVREPTPLQKALQLPPGAVVVGLGRWGELTAGQIANIIRRGAIEYVLQLDGYQPGQQLRAATGRWPERALDWRTLPIVEDSVAAILRHRAGVSSCRRSSACAHGASRRSDRRAVVDSAIEARAAKRLAGPLSEG